MNCANVRRLLSAYCDAELPSERRMALRRHLHNCEACTAALEAFKQLSTLTAKWGDVLPAAPLWQALGPKLIAELRSPAERSPEEMAVLPDPNQKRVAAKRSFKPVIEGLEDRYPLSNMLYAAGATIVFSVIEPARALLRADGIWAAMADSGSAFQGSVAHVAASDPAGEPSGYWDDFEAASLAAVA